MAARRPKDSMFPFPPPVPETDGSLIPYEPNSVSADPETRRSESRNPSTGLFTFAFETRTENARDQRIFQIEERNGRWRVSSAWQAEGTGKLPFAVQVFKNHPDIMNKAANVMLYQADYLIDRVLNFTDALLGRLLPYDGEDVE